MSKIATYTIDELKSAGRGFGWWKDGNSLIYDDEETVAKYLAKFSSCETPLHQEQIPFWSEARGSKKNRCFAVDFGDDSVLVTYKVVNMMKSKFVHVLNIPISMDGNESHVFEVVEELGKEPFVRFLHYRFLHKYFGKSERADNEDNYFFDIKAFLNETSNCKWRSKRHANVFASNPVFRHELVEGGMPKEMLQEALRTRREWREAKMLSKQRNGTSTTTGGNSKKDTLEKAYAKMLSAKRGDVVTMVLLHGNEVVSTQTAILFGDYAVDFFMVHSGRKVSDDPLLKGVYHDSEILSRRFMAEELDSRGVKRLYILGSGGEPFLSRHKYHECHGNRIMCYIDRNI